MIKVVIADDEVKVCQLIDFLVDWKTLNMEVAAIVHNGVDALEAIKRERPDIIITDIKMPGCNGLELIEKARVLRPDMDYIVISGYKQFEYAQKAIQFGVSNYLLKPIDQAELNHTLKKMQQRYLKRNEQLADEERLEEYEQENRTRVRKAFFEEITFRRRLPEQDLDILYCNEKYAYQFRPGMFQTAAIKIDGIHEQTEKNQIFIENKLVHELEQRLKVCFDWDYILGEGIYYLVFNYSRDVKDIKDVMNQILQDLIPQRNVFKNFQVTIGLGEAQDTPEVFLKGFKVAKWAVDQRLLLGTNQVIEGEEKRSNSFVDSYIFRDFNKVFFEAIEIQDIDGIYRAIDQLEERLLGRKETTGYEILQMCKEAVNVYMFALKKLELPAAGAEAFFRQFHIEIHNCGSAEETFAYLKERIVESIVSIVAEKQTLETKPIRVAKSYIAEHISEPISLDHVSDAAGFNTAYFSTIFKKETGVTFSEYLLGRRMELAKELLRDTNQSVACICEAVGYSDVKHFTKNFTKYTSLKPKEYRKLYS